MLSDSLPDRFGPYRVLHPIGAGVLGPVLRAQDPQDERFVAIKVFVLDFTPEQARACAESLQLLVERHLQHAAIVPIVSAGVEGSLPYLVQNLVAGDPIDRTVRQAGPAPPETALALLTPLASALDFAAAVGVRHGRLHPRDVLIDASRPRMTGLGLAQILEEHGARLPARRPYSAPERIAGDRWDRRADVYGLAAIAFELLTGRRVGATGELPPDPVRNAPAQIDPEVRTVVARALATDPAARYSTALEFVGALNDAVLKPGLDLEITGWSRPEPDAAVAAEVDRYRIHGGAARDRQGLLHEPPGPDLSGPESDLELRPPAVLPEPGGPATEPIEPIDPFVGAHAFDPRVEPITVPFRAFPWGVAVTIVTLAAVFGFAFGYLTTERWPVSTERAVPAAEGLSSAPAAPPAPRAVIEPPIAVPPAAPRPAPLEPKGPSLERPRIAGPDPDGRLLVRSSPDGAIVTVNGSRKGVTPLVLRGLPYGRYVIRVTRPGYAPQSGIVSLSGRSPSASFEFMLQRGREP